MYLPTMKGFRNYQQFLYDNYNCLLPIFSQEQTVYFFLI